MHLQCKHIHKRSCLHTFKHLSQYADLYCYNRRIFPIPIITIHTGTSGPSCSHLRQLNNHLMNPAIFRPFMQYLLFICKSHLFAIQHLYHRISKFHLMQFLHLSMCDVQQRQLLSNPSPQSESAE